MSATPVIPGLLYQVKFSGQTHLVAATNGADAIAKRLAEVTHG